MKKLLGRALIAAVCVSGLLSCAMTPEQIAAEKARREAISRIHNVRVEGGSWHVESQMIQYLREKGFNPVTSGEDAVLSFYCEWPKRAMVDTFDSYTPFESSCEYYVYKTEGKMSLYSKSGQRLAFGWADSKADESHTPGSCIESAAAAALRSLYL